MCGGFPTGVLAAVSTSIYQMMEMLEKPIHHMVVRSSHSSTSAISYEQHPTHWFGDTHGVASRSLAPAPPVTNSAAAATHCDGAVGTNRLLLRSQHDPLCSDSILVIYHDPGGAPPTPPGAARGGSGRVPDTRFKLCPLQLLLQSGAPGLLPELRMCSSVTTAGGLHTGASSPFVPLSHETHGRACPPAFAILHEIAECAAPTGAVSKKIFIQNATRSLATMSRCSQAGLRYGTVSGVPRWPAGSSWAGSHRRPCTCTLALARSFGRAAGPSLATGCAPAALPAPCLYTDPPPPSRSDSSPGPRSRLPQ